MGSIYQYPVYIRFWHLLNALFFLALIITGLSMQYANPDSPVIPFVFSVKLHNICGIGLTASYLIFLIGNRISGNGKHYRMQWKGMKKKLMKQARYYIYGYFVKVEPPFPLSEKRKFNPLQALTYALALYAGVPIIIITGWGMLFSEITIRSFFGVSGLFYTDLLHVVTGFLLSVFLVVHIYLCTIVSKPLSNFWSIISGWQETDH